MSKKPRQRKKIDAPDIHPIGAVIVEFDHAVRDIESCALAFVPLAHRVLIEHLKNNTAEIDTAIKEAEGATKATKTAAYIKLNAAFSKSERLEKNQTPTRLQECLFIGLFSVYDAYFGNLLRILYQKNPKLCECIQGEVKTSSILRCVSLDQLKAKILDDYVDDIRRKGYVDQFSQLEATFAVQLKKFSNWPKFVEAAQRRNLYTHCDGIVSQQYLSVCESVGYKFQDDKPPKIGEKLGLDAKYFLEACLVVQEVGIKLAHTLWRKLFETELEAADQHLSDLVYHFLRNEKHKSAICFGEFAHSQKKISTEQWRLMISVNYCIGLSRVGDQSKCTQIINALDLSTALPEFKLARAVLTKDYKQAAALMIKIGSAGDLLDELSYSIWPLFREFRASSEFQQAYKKIYGYDYLVEVKKIAKERKSSAAKIQKNLTSLPSIPPAENSSVEAPTEAQTNTEPKK